VSAAICRPASSWRNTTLNISIPHLLFWIVLCSFLAFHNTLQMLLWSLAAPFPALFQKTFVISFLADVCLNFFGLFGECVCIHCFHCSLVSIFTNETQDSSPVTHIMW
jgi:hypothetical protein